jgi:hypothetical protein
MVGGLRPARSAVHKRNRLLANSSEMDDSCESPGNYEKFTVNQAGLFRPVESRVAPLGATLHDQRGSNSI